MADSITSGGFYFPPFLDNAVVNPAVTLTSYAMGTIAGSGIAFIGKAFIADRSASKILSAAGGGSISWLLGASSITSTAGIHSFGIMDLDATAGPPGRPDGTYDVSTTITGSANGMFPANALKTVVMTDGAKTISHGEMYAVVARVVANASAGGLRVKALTSDSAFAEASYTVTLSATVALPALTIGIPNVLLNFDDGGFGWLMGGTGVSSVTSHSISAGSTNNEIGMRFVLPWNCQVDALKVTSRIAQGAFTVTLYSDPDGTPTTVTAISIPKETLPGANAVIRTTTLQAPISITASTTYLLAVRSDSVSAINIVSYQFNDAAHKISWPGGGSLAQGVRGGGVGAFSMNETHVPAGFGVRINQITGGGATVTTTTTITITVAGAGGLLVHPGMSGGHRG